jgi:SHS2 domain-containing protein
VIGAGHRVVPHTTRCEAWAPHRDQCLVEAVLALVEGFADVTNAAIVGESQIWIERADDDDQLARLRGEIINRLDADSVVPVDLEFSEPQENGLDVRQEVASLCSVHLTGPLPKEVVLSEVSLRRMGGQWHATFAVVL